MLYDNPTGFRRRSSKSLPDQTITDLQHTHTTRATQNNTPRTHTTEDRCSALDPHRWCRSRREHHPHLSHPLSTQLPFMPKSVKLLRRGRGKKGGDIAWKGGRERERESLSSSAQLQHVSSSGLAGISI